MFSAIINFKLSFATCL